MYKSASRWNYEKKMCTKLVVAWSFKDEEDEIDSLFVEYSVARDPSTDRNRNNRRPVEMQCGNGNHFGSRFPQK